MTKRQLILADGTTFIGKAFGGSAKVSGEIIFNTSMTGYQEIISDPSYYDLITLFTYPSIGSYGINRDDFESLSAKVSGVIVKEISSEPSNFRSEETIDQFLLKHNIPGIAGIDTRMLTRILREKGTVKGMISDSNVDREEIMFQLTNEKEKDVVQNVSTTRPYIVPGRGKRIVVIDMGMKHQILHELTERDCHVTVVPYDYSKEEILQFKPDGIIISNGPGNPKAVTTTINTVKSLVLKTPILGIGLGHQIIALACGANTKRLPVGNFGNNFPVKDLQRNQTWITTQSCRYTVDESTLKDTNLMITYRSINDNTIQGLAHKEYPVISVQFQPEGAPGSNETNFIFDTFLKELANNQMNNGGLLHA